MLKKALVFLASGFEEIEALTIVDILRRCNIETVLVGLKNGEVEMDEFGAIICPGGSPGFKNLRENARVIKIVQMAHAQNKIVAAICAAPTVLSDAGVIRGKMCTIYPGMENELMKGGGKLREGDLVVVDENVVTSMGPATAIVFTLKLAEMLVEKKVVEEITKNLLADIGVKFQR
jgi:4-methyl-5(b-hydroxyethyl)-thiazole monophosphate biosynthesis